MYHIITAAARPFLRLWLRVALGRMNEVPRPPGRASAHASGKDPLRVLLFGTGPAVGYGVSSHDLSLTGFIARQLARATGRGVDVDVMTNPAMTVDTALDAIEAVKLSHYDAVILTLGLWDALLLTPVRQWGEGVRTLLTRLEQNSPARLKTFVVTITPVPPRAKFRFVAEWLANRHSRLLNEELRLACAEHVSATLVPFLPPPAPDTVRYRSPETYEIWADLLVGPINHVLMGVSGSHTDVSGDEDESKRQHSLDRLRILDTDPEERFDRIAAMAQRLFGTAAAALTFVDGDRQWFKARLGFTFTETPRSLAFCDYTIRQNSAFVVPDASADARFRNNPIVTGATHVRFYAGHPIETPNGERVGALCVFDTAPRDFSEYDRVLLRNLALMVQRELWTDQEAGALQ